MSESGIERIAVIGGGLMGKGIAQVFAAAGRMVKLQDVSEEALAAAPGVIRDNLTLLAENDLFPAGEIDDAVEPMVIRHLDTGSVDLVILDGEAVPVGGLGIARQLKDEIFNCPPILVLTGRPEDAWLATWSRAEAAVPHPLDPMLLAETVIRLLRERTPAAR